MTFDMVRSRFCRWLRHIIVGCAAIVGVGLVSSFINDPRVSILLAMVVISLFENDNPPPMFKGDLEGMWNKWDEASRRLSDHAQQEFPAGTPEADLKFKLQKQGFKPLPPVRADCAPAGQPMPVGKTYTPCPASDLSKTLVYRWGGAICTETIAVRWEIDSTNAITEVNARYDAACL